MNARALVVDDIGRWASLWPFASYEPWLAQLVAASSLRPESLQAVLATPVAFSAQHGKLAAGLDASDVDGSYTDACLRGLVPTRHDNLHDLLNALTWARFPKAKAALCARQVRLARERGVIVGLRARTREQDACAMVDEGGMVLGPTTRAIFGHAALEDAVLGRELRPFLVYVDSDDLDDGLARLLADDAPIPRVRERHAVMPLVSSGA